MRRPKLKILFVTRVHPPIIGGMENQSFHLIRSIKKIGDVSAIINTKGKRFLPFFIPSALIQMIARAPKFDIIHLSDAVLAPLGRIVKLVHPRVKVVCTVHGLDLTYGEKNPLYRLVNIRALNHLDRVIAVSSGTESIAKQCGVNPKIIGTIPNGVECEENRDPTITRQDLLRLISKKTNSDFNAAVSSAEKPVFIVTVGRLCKRKGVGWFVENVFPLLNKDIFYLIAGSGSEQNNLIKAIDRLELGKRACLLGPVSHQEKKVLMNASDIFVQPNIKVKGDAEGFGLTVLEAASCQIPVVAADLEGIADAVKDKKNGFLVESENAQAFAETINQLAKDEELRKNFGVRACAYTKENCSWNHIAECYHKEFRDLLGD